MSAVSRITPIHRRRWVLRGQVQGVGYRPLIYRFAKAHSVSGFVRNTVAGVVVEG